MVYLSQEHRRPVPPSSTATRCPSPRRPWIVSPWWDLAYVVITPLAIVPLVLLVSRRWFTPEQITLAAISFASLGHHLPGFMRAYGDRDLFVRYRWRFLLAPPLVFAVALLFTPPRRLVEAFDLPWHHLHGLELVLLIWGTWHGLMQTFGFMRIYDLRQGRNDPRTGRLDFWLCLTMFTAGMVFSDVRCYGVAQAMWQAGLPIFDRTMLVRVRWLVGSVAMGVLLAYAADLLRIARQGERPDWVKLLLAGMTGWFYWYTGRLSTNLLIGLAMFEIYHAVQYNAIVWVYNRKRFQQAGDRFGPLGFLFRSRTTMLGLYLAMIGAYGLSRYFSGGVNGPVYWGTPGNAYQWLMAAFVTSSALHFYFDGFIWKVSDRSTQQNLVEEASRAAQRDRLVPGLSHAAKWLVLLAIVAGLFHAEQKGAEQKGAEQQGAEQKGTEQRGQGRAVVSAKQRQRALVALVPDVPECQMLASQLALDRGDTKTAVESARQALALRPRSHRAHANLALALIASGGLEEACGLLRQAIQLAPNRWSYHTDLGLACEELGQTTEAEVELRRAIQLEPELARPRLLLTDFYLRQGCVEKSLAAAHSLMVHDPNGWQSQLAWGAALVAEGRFKEAIGPLQRAAAEHPEADTLYQLGLAFLQAGQAKQAIVPLREASHQNPAHADALFQLGNAFYALRKWPAAIDAWRRCRRARPEQIETYINLGAAQNQAGRLGEALRTYRQGLAQQADSADLNYNLGILLWQAGQVAEGQAYVRRAAELGLELPPEVRAALQAAGP